MFFLLRTHYFSHLCSGYNDGVVKRFTVAEFQGRSANIWSSVWTKPWTVRKIPGPGGPKNRSDEKPREIPGEHMGPKETGNSEKSRHFKASLAGVSSSFLGVFFFFAVNESFFPQLFDETHAFKPMTFLQFLWVLHFFGS